MQRVTLAFLSVERNVNEHECVCTHTEDGYNDSCRQKKKLRKLTMQGLVFKAGGVCSEHSYRVAIIY